MRPVMAEGNGPARRKETIAGICRRQEISPGWRWVKNRMGRRRTRQVISAARLVVKSVVMLSMVRRWIQPRVACATIARTTAAMKPTTMPVLAAEITRLMKKERKPAAAMPGIVAKTPTIVANASARLYGPRCARRDSTSDRRLPPRSNSLVGSKSIAMPVKFESISSHDTRRGPMAGSLM